MRTPLRLLCLLFTYSGATIAAPDVACLVDNYQRYIEEHNEAFLGAAQALEQRSPYHYELLSDFIDYQIRSNALKAHVVTYLGANAPQRLQMNATLAKLAPGHDEGAVHQIMMMDSTYRGSYPEWQSQTKRFLDRQSYTEQGWDEFVEARNTLNRLLSQTPQYPKVISAFRTPAARLCRTR